MVTVPDPRRDRVAEIVRPQRMVPATVEFLDIAGLFKGANEGEGLGNQFLANIRETDAVCQVVRYFSDPDVVHVTGRVDPADHVETIRTELGLADLATVERALPRIEKEVKRDKTLEAVVGMVRKVESWLAEGHRAGRIRMTAEERALLRDLHLLTMKPMLCVANVDEDQLHAELEPIDGVLPIKICAKVEADLAELDSVESREYLDALGLEEPGLEVLIREAYRLLGLQSYFTAGEKEVRAWTVRVGAKAPEAGARAAGKLWVEGKEYVVRDGDVIHFRFNL